MIELIKSIWHSKYGNLILYLFLVTMVGIFFYFDRPNVSTTGDLIEINGTLDRIDKVLIYGNKLKKTERDSTYHIFLREYPCKFQVSYMPYDKKGFYKSALRGDKITLHIASESVKQLEISTKKIRSFSLSVNDKVYLSSASGIRGFGKGVFEILLVVIPLIINFILIRQIINKKRTVANNGEHS